MAHVLFVLGHGQLQCRKDNDGDASMHRGGGGGGGGGGDDDDDDDDEHNPEERMSRRHGKLGSPSINQQIAKSSFRPQFAMRGCPECPMHHRVQPV